MATSRANRRAAARADRKRAVREAPAALPPLPPAPEPQFWFGFSIPWAKLLAARVVIFALLAVDALLQLRHAPRYGAGDFNVAQLPGLGWLAPGRVAYELGVEACAVLFVLAACGVLTRIAVPLAAALYAWLYFGSQLDSYQHHYLVALLLGIACFVPWERPADATARTEVRSWAVRLALVQLAVMYLWAAISKLDPAWLDGRTLDKQVTGSLRHLIDSTIGIAATSTLVAAAELTLAATVWSKRTWRIAAPLGLAFHLGIVATGLEIGLFAWLMIAFYILVIPDRVWVWLGELPPIAALGRVRLPAVLGAAPVAGLLLGVGTVLAWQSRLPHGLDVGLAAGVALAVPIAIRRVPGGRASLALVAAFALWFVVGRATAVVPDYYRFWGGSARRLGDLGTSEAAYRKLIELAPDDAAAHTQLARTLLARAPASTDAALAELHVAEQLDPSSARAYIVEARWLADHGQAAEALAKAKEGTYAEPTSAAARELVDQLSGKTKKAPPPSDDDSEK